MSLQDKEIFEDRQRTGTLSISDVREAVQEIEELTYPYLDDSDEVFSLRVKLKRKLAEVFGEALSKGSEAQE